MFESLRSDLNSAINTNTETKQFTEDLEVFINREQEELKHQLFSKINK